VAALRAPRPPVERAAPEADRLKLSVVIPCLNEAGTLAAVVEEAKSGLAACGDALEWSEVVVSDNGSTDGSREIAVAHGARVVECPVRGYGAALHWGIVNARGDHAVFGDADMSYDFTLLPRFVEAARREPADLILGTRLRGEILPGAMPFLNRRVGTPVLNLIIRICFGLRTSDCNSGMRLVRLEFYRGLEMRCPGMEWASELLIKTAIRRGRYAEIPIRLRPDQRGRPPHMKRWRDGWRHLKSIVMLAPNVTLVGPSLAAAAVGVALLPGRRDLGFAMLCFAYFGLLVALSVKLVLHVDRVRPSRTVAALLRGRFAECGLLAAAALAAGGIALLSSGLDPDGAAFFLVAAAMATAFEVFLWETVRTHLVSDLDSAWRRAEAPAAGAGQPEAATRSKT
jgi:glycosyltransferase involved in cell wall biosynthesis